MFWPSAPCKSAFGHIIKNDDDYLRLHAPEVMRDEPAAIAETIYHRVGDHPCYISFDIDCLDPAFAPGTGTPVPGGISALKCLEIFRALGDVVPEKRLNITGVDIVEVAPCYDQAQVTSIAAVQIAHELLCLVSRTKSH